MKKSEIYARAIQCGVMKPDTLYRRMLRGMTFEEALGYVPAKKRPIYYVYGLFAGGKIFYIGSGQGDRAYRHTVKPYITYKSASARKIRELLAAGQEIEVKILKTGLFKEDARRQEALLIRDLKPECNYYGAVKYRVWGKDFVSLEEVSKDSRCKCTYALLRSRVCCLKWPIEIAVQPKMHCGRKTKPARGRDGKFAPFKSELV